MLVRVTARPSGLYNGEPWPAVGETIDLPDHVAEGMISSGLVEASDGETPAEPEPTPEPSPEPQVETRPATTEGVEARQPEPTPEPKAAPEGKSGRGDRRS